MLLFFNKLKHRIQELEFENKSLQMRLEKQKEFIPRFTVFFNNLMASHDISLVTSAHIERVAEMVKLALSIFPKEDILKDVPNYDYQVFCDSVYLGAFLHDLGKFNVSNAILSKPDSLTEAEFDIVKEHPRLGSIATIDLPLDDIQYNKVIINNIILHHHSNVDGTGYPDKLVGGNIPYEARFVAIFDRLEALLARRSYKTPKTLDESIMILEKEGKVDISILNLVKENKELFEKFEIK